MIREIADQLEAALSEMTEHQESTEQTWQLSQTFQEISGLGLCDIQSQQKPVQPKSLSVSIDPSDIFNFFIHIYI